MTTTLVMIVFECRWWAHHCFSIHPFPLVKFRVKGGSQLHNLRLGVGGGWGCTLWTGCLSAVGETETDNYSCFCSHLLPVNLIFMTLDCGRIQSTWHQGTQREHESSTERFETGIFFLWCDRASHHSTWHHYFWDTNISIFVLYSTLQKFWATPHFSFFC